MKKYERQIGVGDLRLSDYEKKLVNEVLDETFGLGPLEPLIRDPNISDILVNGAKTVYIERHGRLERANVSVSRVQLRSRSATARWRRASPAIRN